MSDSEGEAPGTAGDIRDSEYVKKDLMYKLKAFKRRSTHSIQKVAMKLDETKDPNYDKLYATFLDVEARTDKLARCLDKYIKVQEMFCQVGVELAESLVDLYDGDPPLKGLALTLHQTQKNLKEEVHPGYAAQFDEEVQKPVTRILERFRAIKDDHVRRNRYLSDFDYYRHKKKKLEDAPRNTSSLDSLRKTETKLQTATQKYNAMNDNLSARLKVADEHKAAMLDSALLSIVDLQKAFMQAGDQGIAELHKASNEEEPREAARNSQQILMRLDLENMEPIFVDDTPRSDGKGGAMFSPRGQDGAGIMGLATPNSIGKQSSSKFTDSVEKAKKSSSNGNGSVGNQYTPAAPESASSNLYSSRGAESGYTIPGVAANPAIRITPSSSNKTVKAMFEYEATTETELHLKPGDVVTVLKEDSSGWWQGEMEGRIGWFPYNFVEVLSNGN